MSKCLHVLKSVLQCDLAMQLLVKWYGARNAPGPQNFSPTQEWHLFLVTLFTLLGYEVDKLHLIQVQETETNLEASSPMVVSKKQKPSDNGSNDDWNYILNSEHHKSSKNFVAEDLGLSRLPTCHEAKGSSFTNISDAARMNHQAILFPYLPLTLYSLHLLYEELKLNCEMTESLPLLAQLLYQLSCDLRFDSYVDYYFRDYPLLRRQKSSQISEANLQRITLPNYMSTKPPSIFETLHKLLNFVSVQPFPYFSQVNPRTKNIVYLMALVAHENRATSLDLDKFVKLIVPVGSRADNCEAWPRGSEREIPRLFEHPVASNIVSLYHKMGMTKDDLDILPPSIALILKDVMYQCREQPPSNWNKEVYELVDRQDLTNLEKHSGGSYFENDANGFSMSDPEQDDGMEFDNTVSFDGLESNL